MTKYMKAVVAVVGGVAQAINVTALPADWQAPFGVLVAVLTALGVYQAKNQPAG